MLETFYAANFCWNYWKREGWQKTTAPLPEAE